MKTGIAKHMADYQILYSVISRYMEKGVTDYVAVPRYQDIDNISEIVGPFMQMKLFIQRIEWLEDQKHMIDLLRFMGAEHISVTELYWAIDMFALDKQKVLDAFNSMLADE